MGLHRFIQSNVNPSGLLKNTSTYCIFIWKTTYLNCCSLCLVWYSARHQMIWSCNFNFNHWNSQPALWCLFQKECSLSKLQVLTLQSLFSNPCPPDFHTEFKQRSLALWFPPPSTLSKSLVSKRLGNLLTTSGCLLSVLKEIWGKGVATVLELIDNDIPASVTHYPYYKLLRPNWKINSILALVPVTASFDCQLLSRVSTYMKGAVTAWCFQDNLTIWN